MSELKHIRYEAERRDLLDRFVVLVEERRGHSLALAVERAKIDLTHKPEAWLDMRPFHQPTKIAIERHVFDPQSGAAKSFVSSYSADVVPNLWPAGPA